MGGNITMVVKLKSHDLATNTVSKLSRNLHLNSGNYVFATSTKKKKLPHFGKNTLHHSYRKNDNIASDVKQISPHSALSPRAERACAARRKMFRTIAYMVSHRYP